MANLVVSLSAFILSLCVDCSLCALDNDTKKRGEGKDINDDIYYTQPLLSRSEDFEKHLPRAITMSDHDRRQADKLGGNNNDNITVENASRRNEQHHEQSSYCCRGRKPVVCSVNLARD